MTNSRKHSNTFKANYVGCLIFLSSLLSFNVLSLYGQNVSKGFDGKEFSKNYTVEIKNVGSKNWKSIPVYYSKSSIDENKDASWVSFPIKSDVAVRVTSLITPIDSVIIRPLALTTKNQFNKKTVEFLLDKATKLSVEINGDKLHPLLIFADPPEEKLTKAEKTNVVRFKAGVHQIGDKYLLKSNTTYYLEAGSYLKGSFYGDSTLNNVSIKGRGIINSGYQQWQHPLKGLLSNISFDDGRNILIEGITCIEAGNFQLKIQSKQENTSITLKNVKLIGWNKNTDGIHISDMDWNDHPRIGNAAGIKVLVEDCFIRANDDAILLCDGVAFSEMKNCVIWDEGYGATFCLSWAGHNRIDSAKISNCTIIHKEANNPIFRANHAGEAVIQNVLFENITIEGSINSLINMRIFQHKFDTDEKLGAIRNITFKNITLNGTSKNNILEGFSKAHQIENIVFENLRINGKLIKSVDEMPLKANEFVKNIVFKTQ